MQKKPDPKILETLRARLRERMSELGISQAELADEAGVRRSGLNEVLNKDRLPGCDFIVKIAERLRVSTDYLLREGSGHSANDFKDNPQVIRLLSAFAALDPGSKSHILTIIEEHLHSGPRNTAENRKCQKE
jgi:transcriptional regulator with XRE-family HTH domain